MIVRGEFLLSLSNEPITSDNFNYRRFYYQAKVSRKDNIGSFAILCKAQYQTSLELIPVRHAIVCHIIRGTVNCDYQSW